MPRSEYIRGSTIRNKLNMLRDAFMASMNLTHIYFKIVSKLKKRYYVVTTYDTVITSNEAK